MFDLGNKLIMLLQVVSSLENKKRGVLDFIAKGEKLMSDPNCPAFLQGHVQKLKEAWEDTNQKAQARKKALAGYQLNINNYIHSLSVKNTFY